MTYSLEILDTSGEWGATFVLFATEDEAVRWGVRLTAKGAIGRWRIGCGDGLPTHGLGPDGEPMPL